MKNSQSALKLLLAMFCAANVILGAMGLIGGASAVKAAAIFYGARVDLTLQLSYIIRMLGAFVFTMGVLGGVAAVNPAKNRAIINGIILLLFLRVLQRLIFARHIYEAFGISYARNWVNMIFFFAIAVMLILFRPKSAEA